MRHELGRPEASHSTEMPMLSNSGAEPSAKNLRSGSGAKRKRAIQQKLQAAIESGEMPPYCENCGAIETPTWRKAWIRMGTGTPPKFQPSDQPGAVVAIDELTKDDDGNTTSYKIIKRSLLPDDTGFTQVFLCNRKC
jgi:hypothetical protein